MRRSKRIASLLLAVCMVWGLLPQLRLPARAAENGPMELHKVEGSGSGEGFIYYNFRETTTFTPGETYAFLDDVYGPDDAVAQLGSGAVLQATDQQNNSLKYIQRVYKGNANVATYVDVVEPGRGFDYCPKGGLYKVPDTQNPSEYRYFCWRGGAQNCGPLYAYTYDTAKIAWDDVTVYLNDPGNINSNNSADYTVKLTYDGANSITLEPRSYTVEVHENTATITITDNEGNTIQGEVVLPGVVLYRPGGLNVTGMPAVQGMQPGESVQIASRQPSRTGGYQFLYWVEEDGTRYNPGQPIDYREDGYTLTALWKDIQHPTFTCDTVEVTTGTSGETVQSVIKAALDITDNEPVSECTITVDANDDTARLKGEKQVSVTVTDKAGNKTTESVTLKVVPSPLELTAPVYSGDTLSATLLEPGPDTITEAGIVWSTISSPTTKVNNGKYETTGDMTQPDTLLSTTVELAEGVTYYARAYAVAGGVTYYGPQATVGDNIPSYGVVTIQNNNDRTFTVSRSGGTDGEQTVYYRTVNGSAVGGTHFDHQSGTVTIPDGQSSATITIAEHGVNEVYGDEAATGYSNAIREYFVEIYRVDGGAVIEDNRATAKRTMTGNQMVDRNTFDEKTTNGATGETTRGDYDKDGNLGWTENKQGNQKDTISLPSPTSYVQNVAENIRFYVTFEAKEQDSGYQAVQIVPGSVTDTSIYPYDKNGGKLEGSYSVSTSVGYTALFEHGGSSKDTNWYSYHFPAGTLPNQSSLTQEVWKGNDTGDYIAFPVNTDQVTVSYGACGDNSDKWYTKNVVYHYQFSDTQEPRLLAIGDMGDSTYRVGDSFTVSLIFDEIVDRRNSTLEGKTINTSWGTATYAGGADTNVLYFTGTVPANATTPLTVNSIGSTAVIADMAGNGGHSGSGSVTANVDTKTPGFNLSNGSIANGVGQATISSANENTDSLRYAWSQSSTMPATGWIFLTSDELVQAKTNGYTAMTRQESGTWYLHVLGVTNGNGALAYKQTSVNFGSGSGGSGDPEIVQPPTISVSVDNREWAKSRTITVEAENGTAEYRYGEGEWKSIDGDSITVSQNGTYAFRCVSEMEGAATASATVEKIDTAAPTASIGDMAAGTPTQKAGVYHSITLPVSYLDAQSGVKSAEYAWSSSAAAPSDDWQTVGNQPQLTYTATETEESSIYLHLRVTDQVGNAVTVTSSAYQVISPEGAKAYAPTVTIGLSNKGSEDFTPWDGKSWTNETQTLEWSLSGVKNNNYVVTLPDGRTTTDSSGTILVSRNNTYTVSVVDNTYGGSNSASCTIDKIDTTAPTATYTDVPTGWQSKDMTIGFTFADQGGSGLDTARYAIVDSNTETPTDLTAFSANTGGNVTVSQDGEWYIYYEVTDGTAGTYGDGTARPANTTTGFVGPIRINKNAPTLEVTGGETGGSTLRLTIASSESSVTVSKDGGASVPVGDSYTVTEAGTYTFTATSNAGMTTTKAVTIHSIIFDSGVEKQLVVSGGTATKPAGLEKDGYTFGGWYTGGNEWNFETKVTQNITLTAKWTLNTPTVTLVASMTEATYGETITLTAQVDHKISGLQYTYAWYKDGTLLSGETGEILTLSDVAHSGSYSVKVTIAGEGGLTASQTSGEETISIAPKAIVGTWQGLNQVYGRRETVSIQLDGVVSGDQVSAQVEGDDPQDAGEHPLTAILIGADAPNYILKNNKATLNIQKKPVLFTVTDNAAQADGSGKTATVTPDESTFSGYTVEYRQEGQKVPSPKEPGRYEVWVTITNPNYRHTNGSDTMQVGDLTITQAPPTLYTVTFDGKEADGGTMPSLKTAGGSTLILPVCAFSKADYQFIGWAYDGQTYQPGDHFTMPNGDVTFKTQWEKVFRVDGTITEKTDGEDAKAANAVVSLWLGANKLNETTTDSNGGYRFDNLTPGIYNLVVTKDVRTVTKKVEIKDQNAVCSAVLPKGATNSIVEVVPGSPDIVVGQLDTMFNNPGDAVYTQEDARTVEEGGKVEITFKAAEKQQAQVSEDLEKIEKIGGSNLALVMDYTLEKTVTEVNGTTKTTPITEANVLLEVRLPLPSELQGKQSYTVYRVHEEKAEALTTSPNALGEYFEVSSDKTVLILHVKCFSTYAIGYTEHSGNSGGGGGGGTPTYPPVVEQPEHGTVTISPDAPHKGDTVTITPKPEDGYQVDQVMVTDQNGKEVEVTPEEDGSYTFTQPDGKVTITVTFKKKSAVSHCPRDESCSMAPFTDADRTAWYHDGVHYCVEHGLMVGTSADTFEPNTTSTRGMIATILWRLEGSPMVDTAMNYTDVPLGSWYEEAIRWADSTGVVLGYGDGTFGPDDPITREQMAAMLWRYAGKPQAESSLADFTDGEETSQWAESAMVWAVEQGLIEGMGNAQLNPQGQATRAQTATILMRFVEQIEK